MTTTTLNPADRAIVNQLCNLMLAMNNRNDANAAQSGGTYGHLHDAITTFVLTQTGINLGRLRSFHGWNLGGNETFADDIQVAIDTIVDTDADEAAVNGEIITSGSYTLCDECGDRVRKGQKLRDFRGDFCRIVGGTAPHKPSSVGRVETADGQEFYASVVDCRWVPTSTIP